MYIHRARASSRCAQTSRSECLLETHHKLVCGTGMASWGTTPIDIRGESCVHSQTDESGHICMSHVTYELVM